MNINQEIVVSWLFQEVRGVRLDPVNDMVPSSTIILGAHALGFIQDKTKTPER